MSKELFQLSYGLPRRDFLANTKKALVQSKAIYESLSKWDNATLRKAVSYYRARKKLIKQEIAFNKLLDSKRVKAESVLPKPKSSRELNYSMNTYMDMVSAFETQAVKLLKDRSRLGVKKRAKNRMRVTAMNRDELPSKAMKRFDALKKIVDTHQRAKVEGLYVDPTTAKIVLIVTDQIQIPANIDKLYNLPLEKMINVCFKLTDKKPIAAIKNKFKKKKDIPNEFTFAVSYELNDSKIYYAFNDEDSARKFAKKLARDNDCFVKLLGRYKKEWQLRDSIGIAKLGPLSDAIKKFGKTKRG